MSARTYRLIREISGGIPVKGRRICWLGMAVPLGFVLTPPLLWLLIVLVAPTNWARSHLTTRIERASGRRVQIDGLDVCLNGGITLRGLKIGAPGSVGDPWLDVRRLQMDVSPWELLWGHCEPANVTVEAATLRVLRRDDGSLELADLVRLDRGKSSSSEAGTRPEKTCRLQVTLHGSRVLVTDRPSNTQLVFEDVEGDARCERQGSFAATLSGRLMDGSFQFAGRLDRFGAQPSFEGEFRASDVALEPEMKLLRYLVPVLAGSSGELQGRMNLDVYLRGRGFRPDLLKESLVGRGKVVLDPVQLGGSPLLAEVARLAALPAGDRFASIRSDFVVEEGRIRTDHLTLTAGRVPVEVAGWTDFDGRLDYRVRLAGLAQRIPEQARRFVNDLDLDLDSLAFLRLSGTVDRVSVTAASSATARGVPLEQLIRPDNRDRLKALSRQLRDKLLR